MINYYNVTEKLHDLLISFEDVNSCIVGDLSLIDTNKQTMFPTSYIEVTNATPINGVTRFNITVAAMDIIDIVKTSDVKDGDSWKGNDNKQNILNTMYAVLERLDAAITSGSLASEGWELQGNMQATRFEDSLGNLLTGWSVDFVVDVPNSIVNCPLP